MLSYDDNRSGMLGGSSSGGAGTATATSAAAPIDPMSANPSALKNIHGGLPQLRHRHIWIITGPAGCGKTTVAQYIAEQLNLPYLEGDDFHSKANIEKMAHGHPLTDEDRWDWLVALRQASVAKLAAAITTTPTSSNPSSCTSPSTTTTNGVVLTCSALKKKYRDVIRVAAYDEPAIRVHFLFLHTDEKVLLARVRARKNHYMKEDMVRSQVLSLEVPDPHLERDVMVLDVEGSLTEMQTKALGLVQKALAEDEGRVN